CREARDVEVPIGIDALLTDSALGELANHIQLPLELGGDDPATRDEDLTNCGETLLGDASDMGHIDGHISPSQDALAFFGDDRFEQLFALFAGFGVGGQEQLPNAVSATAGHIEPHLETQSLEKAVRDLDQD